MKSLPDVPWTVAIASSPAGTHAPRTLWSGASQVNRSALAARAAGWGCEALDEIAGCERAALVEQMEHKILPGLIARVAVEIDHEIMLAGKIARAGREQDGVVSAQPVRQVCREIAREGRVRQ